MNIVICGDSHIGAVYGLGKSNNNGSNTRLDDYKKTLNHIVDYTIKSKADVFIQTGDAFDSRTPSPEDIEIMNNALKRLSMANITSVIIMGNHDYRRSGDVFTSAISSLPAKEYPNVRLVLNPEILKVYNGQGESTNILLLPYRDRRMYPGKTTEEDSLFYQNEFSNLINDLDNKAPLIAVGHNFFHTGSYSEYGGTEILTKVDSFKKCNLVVMGHYHQFKILKKSNPTAIYIGSMDKLNFGDEKVDKYFIDYNTNTKKVKILKCPSRPLLDIYLDMGKCEHEDLMAEIEKEVKTLDIKDKIVRIRVSIKDSLMSFIKKREIEKILYKYKAFYVSRIILEPIFIRVVRDNSILEQKDDFSMFKAFLNNQDLTDEERKFILDHTQKIMA